MTRAEGWTGQVWGRGREESISAVTITYSYTNVLQHTVSVLVDVACSQIAMLVFEQLFQPGVDHQVSHLQPDDDYKLS